MSKFQSVLITGGAGFIGSHLVRRFLVQYPNIQILNLDMLTYAGNLNNVKDFESSSNYKFIKGDINNFKFLQELFEVYDFDAVVNLAAESHVDNSIDDPFISVSYTHLTLPTTD